MDRRSGFDERSDFFDQLTVVYRYRRVAASAFLLVILLGLVRTFTTTPLFEARVRLIIETEDDHTAATAGAVDHADNYYWQDPRTYFETYYRSLTGSELARRVVRRLNLGHVAEFAAAENRQPTEPELVAAVLGRVIVRPVSSSRLVDVGFVSADPAFAALAANTLAEEYVQQSLERRRHSLFASLEWLSRELVSQQQKVEAGERAMAEYREEQNALSLEERQNIVVARLNQLNEAVTKAKTNRLEKEALYDQLTSLAAGDSAETIPAILENGSVQSSKTLVADLHRERTALLERYGDKYPEVIKVNASLRDASQRLEAELDKARDAIRNDYESAAAEEKRLEAALEAQKREAMALNRKGVAYGVLEREARSNRQVYEALLLREKELQVVANSRGSNVSIADRALKPGTPFVPTPRHDLLVATLIGIPLSVSLVFFLNRLDDTVKNPDDVSGGLMVPLLGMTPKVARGGRLLMSEGAPPEFDEAFRALRTSLFVSGGSEPTRIVMVTSAQPREGKTTTACNLALALGIGGARVLLIDADMRRPGVNRVLPIADGPGLSDVLTGRATLDAALVTLESPKVSVIRAGASPRNPSELLGSQRMRALLEDMKNDRYDWVIVDTPPVLAVTDAVVLSRSVSAIAFVVGSETTRRPHAVRAIETLATSGPGDVKVVLNNVDFRRNRHYYARYYGYKATN